MHEGQCEECGTQLFAAGERVPAGDYLRVDDGSFHHVDLSSGGVLPPSYDGHVALYRHAAAPCVCQQRQHNARHDATHDERHDADQPAQAASAEPVSAAR